MGVYIYRVTGKRVVCSDGKEANLAVYAFKPYHSWDGEKVNAKLRFKTGCVASQRLADTGKLSGRVVIANDEDFSFDPAGRVYTLDPRVGTFYDDYDLGSERMPVVKDVTPLRRTK